MLYGWELLTPEEEDLIARGVRDGKVYGGPFHLGLFPTDRCNLDCFFCYTTCLRTIAAELDWDVLKRALEEGVGMGVKGVSFGGGGEPLLYRRFRNLLDLLENRGLTVDSMKTNGTALTAETARRLIALRLRRITISLNETDPVEYAKMGNCSPSLFDKAMDGAANIVRAKRDARSDCEISVQVFIWKGNFRRMSEMIAFLLETGTDLVYLNTIEGLPPEQRLDAAETEEIREMMPAVMKKWADRLQTNFMAENLHEFVQREQHKVCPKAIELPDVCLTPNRIEYCNIGWYCPTIDARGRVFPCCHFATDESKSLGNLREQSLREIWYGPRAQAYRKEMRHLLLTEAARALLPAKSRFIAPLCMERAACAFNFYLSSSRFYHRIHEWAESGPGKVYTARQRRRARARGVLRAGKRAVKRLLGKT